MFKEYFFILQYFIIALIIAFLLFRLSILLVYQSPDSEKVSVYDVVSIHMVMHV